MMLRRFTRFTVVRRRHFRYFQASVILTCLFACSGDTTSPAIVEEAQAYWALQLNYHAVNMATVGPYNTLQLRAIPVTVAGGKLPGSYQIHYSAQDSSVTIDSAGMITAHFATPGQPVPVIASLTLQGVTLSDTALVQVTDTVPHHPLATFSVQPVAGDSAKLAVDGGNIQLPVYATDAIGDTLLSKSVSALVVYFRSSNPSVAGIANVGSGSPVGTVTSYYVGPVTFYATTWAYGVAKEDSLSFRIGYPIQPLFVNNICAGSTQCLSKDGILIAGFSPSTITIGGGGVVSIETVRTDTVDINFDQPITIVSQYGNVPSTGPKGFTLSAQTVPGGDGGGIMLLQFQKQGTYSYSSHKLGASGTIIVKD